MTGQEPPIEAQRTFWNKWNAATREASIADISLRQSQVALGWLDAMGRKDLAIVDVGCGAGWFCGDLQAYGHVTGIDISDAVLERAQERLPDVKFIAGDFMCLDLQEGAFDVVVSLEVLSHVQDQPAFLSKLARLLKPGGALIMATQNRPILERNSDIPPPAPGQIRRWVDSRALRNLLAPHFEIRSLRSLSPKGHGGFLRFVNSYKVEHVLRAVALDKAAQQVKEWLGLGWTLMVLARKRAA